MRFTSPGVTFFQERVSSVSHEEGVSIVRLGKKIMYFLSLRSVCVLFVEMNGSIGGAITLKNARAVAELDCNRDSGVCISGTL